MRAVKVWLQKHAEDPSLTRLRKRDELQNITTLRTVLKDSTVFKKPKQLFVLVKSWDSAKHGEFDSSKVVKEEAAGAGMSRHAHVT